MSSDRNSDVSSFILHPQLCSIIISIISSSRLRQTAAYLESVAAISSYWHNSQHSYDIQRYWHCISCVGSVGRPLMPVSLPTTAAVILGPESFIASSQFIVSLFLVTSIYAAPVLHIAFLFHQHVCVSLQSVQSTMTKQKFKVSVN